MKAHAFNTLAERINREFFFQLFGVPLNLSSYGIDFIDHRRMLAVELKSAHAKDGLDKHNFSFNIRVNQIYDYLNDLSGYWFFWAFMPFELKRPIEDITENTIEESIGRREIWVFGWDYIHTFTAFDDGLFEHHGTGNYNALFRILGLPNPYPRKPVKGKKKASQPYLRPDFQEAEGCQKKAISVSRSQLYMRRDRTEIHFGDVDIYMEKGRCDVLLEAFFHRPYQLRKPNQLNIEFP